jgi:hypothetical protein
MTKVKSSNASGSSNAAVVVYGLDETGKAKAGRFPAQQAPAARKAADALRLAICRVNRPKLIEIIAKIPVGRLHAQGKAFLPYVRRDLYDQLAAAAAPGRSIATAAKAGPSVAAKPAKTRSKVFVILGFDERLKPRGARYSDPNEEQLIKAATEMNLNLYELRTADLISWADTLPVGKLPATGRTSVPEISQTVYSEIAVGIAEEADAVPRGKIDDPLPAQKGPPENWDVIDTGHIVIAQESPEYGWAEAIVLNRKDGLLTLRYRDYPKLPKFYRRDTAVALLKQTAK